jgi:hypothetical protein
MESGSASTRSCVPKGAGGGGLEVDSGSFEEMYCRALSGVTFRPIPRHIQSWQRDIRRVFFGEIERRSMKFNAEGVY